MGAMKRLLFGLELVFLATFWWQTRINVAEWWPELGTSLMVDYLMPFLYLSDVLFGAVLVVWLVEKRDWRWVVGDGGFKLTAPSRLYLRPLFWVVLLLLVAAISVMVNGNESWGWYRWFKLLEGVLLAVWVRYRWADASRRYWYGWVLLLGLGLESVLLIGEWLRQGSLGWQWVGEWWFDVYTPGVAKIIFDGREYLRPMGTFAHANIAAGALVISLPLAGMFFKAARWQGGKVAGKERRVRGEGGELELESKPETRNSRPRAYYSLLTTHYPLVWFALIGIALFVTFSRSAWLVAVGLAVWYWLWAFNRAGAGFKMLYRRRIWILLGSGFGLLLLISPVVGERFLSLMGSDSWSLSLRGNLNDVAWRLWQERPWWGVGLNSFTVHVQDYGAVHGLAWWRQPVHNVVLLWLAEMGAVGVVTMVGVGISGLGWLGREVWLKRRSASLIVWILTGVWLGIGVLGMVDHYWWTSQQAFLMVWGVGGGTVLLRDYE